jgi:hypothetical protein
MEKLDLTKKYKSYFTAKPFPELVHIEPAQYLSICGKGEPGGRAFSERIEALYTSAYTLKFSMKNKGQDFVVSKLEGLWWFDEINYPNKTIDTAPVEVPRSEWEFRLLIRLPDFVNAEDVESAKETAYAKKGNELIKEVEFFSMSEGKSIQMMHIGPFANEPESLRQIMAFSEKHKLERNGHHHEIYLSDFRKSAPEKLKTILREPVK